MALLVAGAFIVFGALWVLFTDTLLYAVTHDPAAIARLETAKGWTFVGLTAVLLFAVTLTGALRMARAQATVSAVIQSIGDGVLLLGADRSIVHANPAAVRMLQCPLEELVGMDAPAFARRFRVSYPNGSLVPPDKYASQRVYDVGGPLMYKALLHPNADSELIISVTAAAVAPEHGEPVELVVSVMHDITAEERLTRLRDRFIAAAAHQFKTPVAIVKANAQLLSRLAPERLSGPADAIDRECNRMDRRLQNLLLLARASSDRLQLVTSEIALQPFLGGIADEMARGATQNAVLSEFVAAPQIYGDAERLSLAVRDLIEDALRSARPGTALTVTLTEQGHDALIGCRYHPLPRAERTIDEYGDYDDIGINRSVTQLIATAHGGGLEEELTAPDQAVSFIRLPAIAS